MDQRRLGAFASGMGVSREEYTCAECGYTSDKRRNFVRSDGEKRTCSTGHYTTTDGETKRQKNAYARPR
jgi:hypothetical protein